MKNKFKKMYIPIFHSNTIFTQFILFTIIVSLIPIIFISTLLFQKISSMVTKDLVNSHKQLMVQYVSNIDDKLFQYKDSLNQISNNTIILNTLMDKTGEDNPYIKGTNVSMEVTKSLRLESHKELRNCMIYSHMEDNPIYGTRVTMMGEGKREKWYGNNRKINDYIIYTAVDGKSSILSMIKNIIYVDLKSFQKHEIGFIKLDIDIKQLLAPVTENGQDSYYYDVILLDDKNKIIYSTNKSYNDIFDHIPISKLRKDKVRYYKDVMISSDSIKDIGFNIVFLFNNSQLSLKKAEMQKTILPVIFLVILIIVITAYIFTRGFSSRVERLVQKFKVAETGDLTISGEIEGNDEIAVLDKQFNHMLTKLDRLIQKNYIQQLEKKETELKNLQLQINPHFLYNTLETISSIAAVKGAFLICELCEKLGDIFRYSLGKNQGEYVTVVRELQHTQNYIYIQKTRFGNKFEVFYNVEPGLENLMILRFILQPIVENAIVHGLSKTTKKGILEIEIGREGDTLLIKIADDGIGMTTDKVEALIDYIDSDNSRHEENRQSIGIRNVNQRIKLACGKEYGISIESDPYQGSCFTIHLPIIQSGGNVK